MHLPVEVVSQFILFRAVILLVDCAEMMKGVLGFSNSNLLLKVTWKKLLARTHSFILSLAHFLFSLTLSHFLSRALSHSLSHTFSFSFSRTLIFSLSHTLSFSLSQTYSLTNESPEELRETISAGNVPRLLCSFPQQRSRKTHSYHVTIVGIYVKRM